MFVWPYLQTVVCVCAKISRLISTCANADSAKFMCVCVWCVCVFELQASDLRGLHARPREGVKARASGWTSVCTFNFQCMRTCVRTFPLRFGDWISARRARTYRPSRLLRASVCLREVTQPCRRRVYTRASCCRGGGGGGGSHAPVSTTAGRACVCAVCSYILSVS